MQASLTLDKSGLLERPNPDPSAPEHGLLQGPPASGRPRGPPSGSHPHWGWGTLALLQNVGPRVRAASARTSVSSARDGFTCTRGSVCPPARWAPRPSPARGNARVSGGLLAPPPSLQGPARGVRRPAGATGECRVVVGGPTSDVGHTRGAFSTLEPS